MLVIGGLVLVSPPPAGLPSHSGSRHGAGSLELGRNGWTMNTERIMNLLGQLQADPDASASWDALTEVLTAPSASLPPAETLAALERASEAHRSRGEYAAVARLIELGLSIVTDAGARSLAMRALASVLRDHLFEEHKAMELLGQLALAGDTSAASSLAESTERKARWEELAESYASEVESATDDVYRGSMLMRSAEMELRYAPTPNLDRVIERLEQAVRLDASNVQAGLMLEQCYRKTESWEEVVRCLERLTARGPDVTSRVQSGLRLARICRYRLEDTPRTVAAYERLLRDAPGHTEALQYLSTLYTTEQRWDELVALYEREVKQRDLANPESIEQLLQIAELHRKERGHSEDAEPWFERIRKLAPAHELTLDFFREYCRTLDDESRLIDVLQAATNVMVDGAKKAAIATEIAQLLEKQQNAQRAIEQYKAILRQDPDNETARESLKRLYKSTSGFTALVELLRQQLERTPADQYQKRLEILREVATVYRTYVRSDTSLVTVLHQIVQLDERLDENDVEELRELVRLYDVLGRHRELLTYQTKLAQVTPNAEEKTSLFRSVARRWLEQFTNFQNATEAYESLLAIAPGDPEATEKLNDLYRRRRAWEPLFGLLSQQAERASGAERVGLLREMAEIAADKLHKVPDALKLYKQILDEDASRADVLDALEKHAERHRDFETLAFSLEKRVAASADDASKSTFLQRLGTVYAEHLGDTEASIKTWRRVLELTPGHARALRVLRDAYLQKGDYDALTELYAAQSDWEGLAEVLSNAADRTSSGELKVELSQRAARVFEDNLGQPERAMRSYERMLTVDPSDMRAVQKLIPIYEAEEKWVRLPPLYELVIAASDSDEDKLGVLFRLIDVLGQRLLDKKNAALAARRAFELSPTNERVAFAFESTTRAAGTWDAFVEAYQTRLQTLGEESVAPPPVVSATPSEVEEGRGKKKGKKKGKRAEPEAQSETTVAAEGADSDERRKLELTLARVQANELLQVDAAIATYQRILSRLPREREAEQALLLLLIQHDRRNEQRSLLAHRIEHAEDLATQVALLSEFAEREEQIHAEPERAIEVWTKLLELVPDHRQALTALSRLLLASEQTERAVAIMERERDLLAGEERNNLELHLAELYLSALDRPKDALAAAVRVLDGVGSEPRALSIVERLLDNQAVRFAAAEVLAGRFASMGEPRREAQALGVMLSRAEDRETKLLLVGRLCDLHADRLGERSAALDYALRALAEFPEQSELWERAESLAVAAGRPTDLADALRLVLAQPLPHEIELGLCERAAHLHEERLGDPVGATPYLERLLVLAPSNQRAFERLKDILTAAERWGELEAMYGRAIERIEDSTRRIEMLSEVALIAEEIVGDPVKAIAYFERILEIDPLFSQALETLDRLYSRYERHEPLAQLLTRRLEITEGEAAVELKRRLAVLFLDKLHRPEDAIGYVEDVLEGDVNDFDARALGERILGIVALRPRMARALESVYLERDEIRDLVRILEVRLECLEATTGEDIAVLQSELLRRIATLRDERLRDDRGAFEVLARYVPKCPADDEARTRMIEIGRRLGDPQQIARVLHQTFDVAPGLSERAAVGMQLAHVEESLLSDIDAAEKTYKRVTSLDPRDAVLTLPAAEALERIYTQTRQMSELAEVLTLEVGLVESSHERREIQRRLGQIHRDELADGDAAIAAYVACLEESDDDTDALSALDALYLAKERYADLSAILARRYQHETNSELRRVLLTRRAELLADKLGEVDEAIAVWQAVIDEFGPEDVALRALERLFERKSSWQELASCLERHIEVTTDGAERLDLFARLGEVRCQRLADPNGALAVYRDALEVDPRHEATRQALLSLLEDAEPAVRREAARILRPVFEQEENGELLLRVLAIEVEFEDDPMERQQLFRMATSVAETRLENPVRAFEYASRGARESLGSGELEGWLAHLDRLARAGKLSRELVALMRDIVGEILDGAVQLDVTLRIAAMARDDLSDLTLAREYYEKALEIRPDELSALVALERLHEESGDASRLLEILVRRAEVADNEAEQKALLFRQAHLLEDRLGEPARAVEVYERLVDIDFDPKAISALDRLYRKLERFETLIVLLQRRLDRASDDKADLLALTAQIYADHVGDLPRALDELEQALLLDAAHASSVALLEQLLANAKEPEERARAASLLEPVYVSRGEHTRVLSTQKARLDATSMPEERRDLLLRMAQIEEEQLEDFPAALETMARLFHEDCTDGHAREELERLAKVAGAERRLAEIYESELEQITTDDPSSASLAVRAGELFALQGEMERSLIHYRRALRVHPDNAQLFAAIDAILYGLSRHQDRVELYRDSLAYRFDAEDRLNALHVVVALQRYQLAQPAEAIASLCEAMEIDDMHPPTLDALMDLYRSEAKWPKLAELLLHRADRADDVTVAAAFRVTLADLWESELGSPDRAIDQLEEVTRQLPNHPEALQRLEQLRERPDCKRRAVEILRPLYESADDWQSIIRLNRDRLELAEDATDRVAVLRETAELYEQRAGDVEQARRALVLALEAEPSDLSVRAEFERLSEITGEFSELVRVYSELLEASPDLAARRDLLAVVAQTYDARLDDPRRALSSFGALHELEPEDLATLEQMERLATLLSDWPTLVKVLVKKADLVLGDDDRASCLRRVGEVRRDMLEDPEGAIEAYEKALDLEPDSTFTVDCLIGLLSNGSRRRRLIELLIRRVELADPEENDLKFEHLLTAAGLIEVEPGESQRAIDLLASALELRANDLDVMKRLARLYESERQWPELLENLRVQASLESAPTQRAVLRARSAEVLAAELSDFDEALECYRAVLEDVPGDEKAQHAVFVIGRDHEEHREKVAEILVPVLTVSGAHRRLVDVLELRLTVLHDPFARAETLREIKQIWETQLSFPKEALDALLRAVTELPGDVALFDEINRLAAVTDGYAKVADVLDERARATFDPELVCDLCVRLGQIAEDQLKNPARAVDAYRRAVDQTGDRGDLLQALDRLLVTLGDAESLVDVLERRAAVESDDTTVAELYYRLAVLQLEHFKQAAQAIGTLRMALDRVTDHSSSIELLESLSDQVALFDDVADVLEPVYRSTGRCDRLAALFEKRVRFARGDSERLDMRRQLAQVLEEECHDQVRAAQVLLEGLKEDLSDGLLLDEIERLGLATNTLAASADALVELLEADTALPQDLLRDIWLRLAGWYEQHLKVPPQAEKCLLCAARLDPANEEILGQLETLYRSCDQRRELFDVLRQRARLVLDEADRERLIREAAELAKGLDDTALHEAVVRELLSSADGNLWALRELSELRRKALDYQELFQLLEKQIELEVEPRTLFGLRHEAARIARDHLGRLDRAIELLWVLFEDEPSDQVAAAGLSELLTKTERYEELCRVLDRQLELATSTGERKVVRLETARIREKLGDSMAAMESLRAILDEEPNEAEAVLLLSGLLEQTGQNQELAELLERQIDSARERQDGDAEVRLMTRLAEVCEVQLDDRERAVATYRTLLGRYARHVPSLLALLELHTKSNDHHEMAGVLEELLQVFEGSERGQYAAQLADVRQRLGDTEREAEAVAIALSIDENDTKLRARLLSLYDQMQRYPEVCQLICRQAELTAERPRQIELYREAAEVYRNKLSDAAGAATVLERASQLVPENRELLLELCDAYNDSGRSDLAAEALERIVASYGGRRSRELADIHRRLGEAYLTLGHPERAREEYEKAFRIEPGNVTVIVRLAEVSMKIGDAKRAQQLYGSLMIQVQKLEPGGPITKALIYARRGEASLVLGEMEKAKTDFERALQADPSLGWVKEKLVQLKG